MLIQQGRKRIGATAFKPSRSSESSSNDDTAPTMQDNSSSAQDGKIAIKDVLDIIKFSFIELKL